MARPVGGAIGKCLQPCFDASHARINWIPAREYIGAHSTVRIRSRVRMNSRRISGFRCVAARILADCSGL